MHPDQTVTSPDQLPKAGYIVVLVSTNRVKETLKFKSFHMTRADADAARDALSKSFNGWYRALGPKQARSLLCQIKSAQHARRVQGAAKAAKTRKAKGPNNFIRCTHCGAKSKLLFSEFGGLQTRQCNNGHRFEHDKWLADRPLIGLM